MHACLLVCEKHREPVICTVWVCGSESEALFLFIIDNKYKIVKFVINPLKYHPEV